MNKREYMREWREKNKDKLKQYRKEHKKMYRQANYRYYLKHKEDLNYKRKQRKGTKCYDDYVDYIVDLVSRKDNGF